MFIWDDRYSDSQQYNRAPNVESQLWIQCSYEITDILIVSSIIGLLMWSGGHLEPGIFVVVSSSIKGVPPPLCYASHQASTRPISNTTSLYTSITMHIIFLSTADILRLFQMAFSSSVCWPGVEGFYLYESELNSRECGSPHINLPGNTKTMRRGKQGRVDIGVATIQHSGHAYIANIHPLSNDYIHPCIDTLESECNQKC